MLDLHRQRRQAAQRARERWQDLWILTLVLLLHAAAFLLLPSFAVRVKPPPQLLIEIVLPRTIPAPVSPADSASDPQSAVATAPVVEESAKSGLPAAPQQTPPAASAAKPAAQPAAPAVKPAKPPTQPAKTPPVNTPPAQPKPSGDTPGNTATDVVQQPVVIGPKPEAPKPAPAKPAPQQPAEDRGKSEPKPDKPAAPSGPVGPQPPAKPPAKPADAGNGQGSAPAKPDNGATPPKPAGGDGAAPVQGPPAPPPGPSEHELSLLADYGKAAAKRIKSQCRNSEQGARGTVRIEFDVDRKGRLLDVRVSESSGHNNLDNDALEATRAAFNEKYEIIPFPSEVDVKQWTFKLAIAYPLY